MAVGNMKKITQTCIIKRISNFISAVNPIYIYIYIRVIRPTGTAKLKYGKFFIIHLQGTFLNKHENLQPTAHFRYIKIQYDNEPWRARNKQN